MKEYVFIIRTKENKILTFWDLCKNNAEAAQKSWALHQRYDGLLSWYDSPNDYKSIVAFLNVMYTHGNGQRFTLPPK